MCSDTAPAGFSLHPSPAAPAPAAVLWPEGYSAVWAGSLYERLLQNTVYPI